MIWNERVDAVRDMGWSERHAEFLAARAFATPRFRVLYEAWRDRGDAVLETTLSHVLTDAVARRSGELETYVLPHTYLRLLPSSARHNDELWLTRHRTRPRGSLVLSSRPPRRASFLSVAHPLDASENRLTRRRVCALRVAQSRSSRPRGRRFVPPGMRAIEQQQGRERPPSWFARVFPPRSRGSLTSLLSVCCHPAYSVHGHRDDTCHAHPHTGRRTACHMA